MEPAVKNPHVGGQHIVNGPSQYVNLVTHNGESGADGCGRRKRGDRGENVILGMWVLVECEEEQGRAGGDAEAEVEEVLSGVNERARGVEERGGDNGPDWFGN